MMNGTEAAQWMAIAHLPGWTTIRIYKLLRDIRIGRRLSLAEFFDMTAAEWASAFRLSAAELGDLAEARERLSDFSGLAAELEAQGCELIPLFSADYPAALTRSLGASGAPALLYVAGNRRLLREATLTLIGSAAAGDPALEFARGIAAQCAEDGRVLVSGMAKGVEQAALDVVLERGGRSILVPAQGLLTFIAGAKRYRGHTADGDLLMLSAGFPRAPSSQTLAAARNAVLFALADEIYVAEPECPIWLGAAEKIYKGKRIYVRAGDDALSESEELLLCMVPTAPRPKVAPLPEPLRQLTFGRLRGGLEGRLRACLGAVDSPLSARTIKEQLDLDLDAAKLSRLLRNLEFILTIKGRDGRLQFALKRDV